MSDSQRPHGLQPTRLLSPRDFPGKSTGVGCHHLLCLSGYPGPISGQRTNILLWATAQHCPSDIRRGPWANGYDFPRSSVGKESACNAGDTGSIPGLGRSPCKGKWQPTPVFLPGEFYGQRNLAGYSPWDNKELDMTKQLTQHCISYTQFCIFHYFFFWFLNPLFSSDLFFLLCLMYF